MDRNREPEFDEGGFVYELANRDFSAVDKRQPVLADNAAHAPGKTCQRCEQLIAADQDARLLPDGRWIHDTCPVAW